MPRITLPLASGGLFDSWEPLTWGMAIVYWLGAPPEASVVASLVNTLEACETLLYFVAAALLPAPAPDGVAALATRLYKASVPTVVQARAPVLLLERVAEPSLCQTLVEYWQRNDKVASMVGCEGGNTVNTDVKRRRDVQLDHPELFVKLRDCLVRRVMPAIAQAFHARIMVIETPIIGCYDAASGGWFRRHRDNTSRHTAHRQFALSLNLNADDEYDGGELRFPEFGRELYRPVAGGVLIFSSSLVHEVVPVTRGHRLGVFTFLSASGPPPSRPVASR